MPSLGSLPAVWPSLPEPPLSFTPNKLLIFSGTLLVPLSFQLLISFFVLPLVGAITRQSCLSKRVSSPSSVPYWFASHGDFVIILRL